MLKLVDTAPAAVSDPCPKGHDRSVVGVRIDKLGRRSKFGMTLNDYNEMLRRQFYSCASCAEPLETRRAHVDHDHRTGRVRGILCSSCNTALGLLYENPATILRLLRYVRSF